MASIEHDKGTGVRALRLSDQAPECEYHINRDILCLKSLVKPGHFVVDIGCGYGHNRRLVEESGGKWIGIEPFEGGAHTLVGDAQHLPLQDESIDLIIMDSVLEHIPDVGQAFREAARVLKKTGRMVGYSAFMECFHEISYSHLSYKALEYYANISGMRLVKLSGGSRFGIDYHARVLLYPLDMQCLRPLIAGVIRGINRFKAVLSYAALRFVRKRSAVEARDMADMYYKVECLRQSNGFQFIIEKSSGGCQAHENRTTH